MNILFIGPYRQLDGWGQASQEYIKALMYTGHNITLRPIYMGHSYTCELDPRILDLEQNKSSHYDVVIQNVLPDRLEYANDTGTKYINLALFETNNLEFTKWPKHINQMDEVWVSSKYENESLKNSGVTIPISVIKEPIDVTKFSKRYDTIKWQSLGLHDKFVFYFIGEYIPRKNLSALITAFHREFKPSEDVELLIKTNKSGMSQQQIVKTINDNFVSLKEKMKIYHDIDRYKQEWVIAEYLTNESLYGLHQICDCFVMPSRGEACCRPLMDAVGFGKQTIITDNTGMVSYTNKELSHIIPSTIQPVISSEHPLSYLYTSRETWSEINMIDLQEAMRKTYNKKGLPLLQHSSKCQDFIQKFSYDNIAQEINNTL